jgi:glycosyltransferase involved in cell wall biosynthesis
MMPHALTDGRLSTDARPQSSSKETDRIRIGILSLALDSWGPRWNSRHQVLTRLARRFPVVWVNPAPEWRRVVSAGRLRSREQTVAGLPRDFVVHDSSALTPRVHRPHWLSAALLRARLARARSILERRGCTHVVLYLWHVAFADALSAVKSDLSVYHIYDEYSHSEHEVPLSADEERLLRRVGQVFTVSETMQRRKGALSRHSTLISNGVDYDAFATAAPEPADLQAIPHPRVGYTGYVKKQVDWELLLGLAQQLPDLSFVFVGARHAHPEITPLLDRLEAMPNVHFLGSKPTSELSRYPQHFDVCLMPYRVNDYTKYIYPLKLHEYLATGRPIVSVPLPALRGYEHLVEIASGVPGWQQAIQRQLATSAMDVERQRARRTEARRHDWSEIADRIAAVIRERIAAGEALAS